MTCSLRLVGLGVVKSARVLTSSPRKTNCESSRGGRFSGGYRGEGTAVEASKTPARRRQPRSKSGLVSRVPPSPGFAGARRSARLPSPVCRTPARVSGETAARLALEALRGAGRECTVTSGACATRWSGPRERSGRPRPDRTGPLRVSERRGDLHPARLCGLGRSEAAGSRGSCSRMSWPPGGRPASPFRQRWGSVSARRLGVLASSGRSPRPPKPDGSANSVCLLSG
jgi:hypothetical protein